MTSVTWDRHRGHAETYDIVDVGFNYRLDEPRAALLLSQLRRLDDEVAARRRLTRRYRELLAGVEGVTVPYEDAGVDESSCYVMAVLVDDASRRDAVRLALRERHGIQTSLLYPAVHRFTAYRERFPGVSLPRTEDASAREVTLPLFRHLPDEDVERVVDALRQELAA
jgi:dTDP-4-amino-4,6-dideoxygalactose transaminase